MKKLLIWVGFGLSGLFLYLALKGVHFAKVAEALSNADYAYLVPAFVLLMASYFLRTVRWQLMFSEERRIPKVRLFSYTMIGFMANNVLPARMGEVLRAFVLWRKEKVSRSYSLATIVVERVFDLFALLLFLVGTVVLFDLPQTVQRIGMVAGLAFVAALAVMLSAIFGKARFLRISEAIAQVFSPRLAALVEEKLESFISGLETLRRKRDLTMVIVWSVVIWGIWGCALFFTLQAFPIDIPIYAVVFMVSFVNLGVLIPSSPGFVGTYQFLCVTALAFYGVDESVALSFSFVLHALWYVPLTLLGALFFWKENLGFGKLKLDRLGEEDAVSESDEKLSVSEA